MLWNKNNGIFTIHTIQRMYWQSLEWIPIKGFENGTVENLKKYILAACQLGCDVKDHVVRTWVYGDMQAVTIYKKKKNTRGPVFYRYIAGLLLVFP